MIIAWIILALGFLAPFAVTFGYVMLINRGEGGAHRARRGATYAHEGVRYRAPRWPADEWWLA